MQLSVEFQDFLACFSNLETNEFFISLFVKVRRRRTGAIRAVVVARTQLLTQLGRSSQAWPIQHNDSLPVVEIIEQR